jgi:hypothetical protein
MTQSAWARTRAAASGRPAFLTGYATTQQTAQTCLSEVYAMRTSGTTPVLGCACILKTQVLVLIIYMKIYSLNFLPAP